MDHNILDQRLENLPASLWQKIAQIDEEYEEELKGWEASKAKFLKDQDEFNSMYVLRAFGTKLNQN